MRLALAAALLIAGHAAADPIPRRLLFEAPAYSQLALSPDGHTLAFLHPFKGVLNVWVAPADRIAAAHVVSRFADRPVESFRWTGDGRSLVLTRDATGGEDGQLWVAPAQGGRMRRLVYQPGVQTKILTLSAGTVLVSRNRRDRRYPDVDAIDLANGHARQVYRNRGDYIDFIADGALVPVIGIRSHDDGSQSYHRLDRPGAAPFLVVSLAALRSTKVLGLQGNRLLALDSRASDRAELTAIDTLSGATTRLARADRADITRALFDAGSGDLLATFEDPLTGDWTVRAGSFADELAAIEQAAGSDFKMIGQADRGRRWLIETNPPDRPGAYLWWDRTSRQATELITARPALDGVAMAARRPVTIRSRDGLLLTGYLTLPRDTPPGPLPLVLVVHGGPWSRDAAGFDPRHQWLADRGYAALSVNFRGSVGFGKAFTTAGDRQWGAAMQDDLIDAADWAVGQGIAARDRIGLFGVSYGGYAAMAALGSAQDRFRCAVAVSGPSDLKRLIAGMPAWWHWQRPQFLLRAGNPAIPAEAAALTAHSPATMAATMNGPLLLATGETDPRVPVSQADAMTRALARNGKPVTYLRYAGEGHAFAKDASTISLIAVAEHFLAGCLGGHASPYEGDLRGADLTAVQGAALVPGLVRALPARPRYKSKS